jgi:N6-L-threonylcarbamoyladenine synthase
MVILGIETTCDETAAAVVERTGDAQGRILSNIVLSQIDEHAEFGGVVPEIAARAHVEARELDLPRAKLDRQQRLHGGAFGHRASPAMLW